MFTHHSPLKTSSTLVLCVLCIGALVLAGTSQTVAAPGEPGTFPASATPGEPEAVASSAAAQDRGTRFLRQPDVSADGIVFVHANDLWRVDRDGGEAIRLTSSDGAETDPAFSPDGRWIAFSAPARQPATRHLRV